MMNSFASFPQWAQGIVGFWSFILFVWAFSFLIIKFGVKRRMPKTIRNTLLLIVTAVLYITYQLISSRNTNRHEVIVPFADAFGQIPYFWIVVICGLFTTLLAFWTRYSREWTETHITDASIKEAIDTLPAGVCIFEETGRIYLKNAIMEKVYGLMTGKDLLNGCELEKTIRNSPAVASDKEKIVITLSDETTWSFVKKDLMDGECRLVAIEAYDVTEEYGKTLLLQERRKALQSLNEKLVTYNKNILSTISAQEILNAKVKIHDELGETLLAIRHYLTVDNSKEEKDMILQKLNRNISFLQRETELPAQDEYELMIGTAKNLGVKVVVDGELPQKEPAKHIIATGIHECFTNTLRHALGDELRLSTENDGDFLVVRFSNNGRQPENEVIEKGGLSSLRSLTEQCGGTMEIVSKPEFVLKITLPMEDEDGI